MERLFKQSLWDTTFSGHRGGRDLGGDWGGADFTTVAEPETVFTKVGERETVIYEETVIYDGL